MSRVQGAPGVLEGIRAHERKMAACLTGQGDLRTCLEEHRLEIQWLLGERLAHLLATLTMALLFFLTLTLLPGEWLQALLLPLEGAYLVAYLIHLYRLERRLWSWYELDRKLRSLDTLKGEY